MTEDFDYLQMMKGELYLAQNISPEYWSFRGKALTQKINTVPIEDSAKIIQLERELFGKTGENIYVTPPIQVDYGSHVEIGDNFYCNMEVIF